MTKLDKAQHKADKAQQPTPAGKDSDKVTHLTEINRQLEDHVTSLDSQLEQLQQELEAAGAEAVAAAAHTQASLQGSLKAQHAQHETSLAQHRAEVASVQEACSAKDLQVVCAVCRDTFRLLSAVSGMPVDGSIL